MVLEMFSLDGKRALITGASRGIGEAIAVGYAQAGADVALVARSEDDLVRVAERVRAEGRNAVSVRCDVTDDDDIDRAVRECIDGLGFIDILVNNAGGPVFNAPLIEFRPDGFRRIVELNLLSTARFCQRVGAHMCERHSGSVLNNASVTVLHPNGTQAAYGAAKAGVVNMTQALAQEWGPFGVRVNAFSPGFVRTHINRKLLASDEASAAAVAPVPLGRWADPEEMIGLAIWLASDASSYVTGAHIAADGGLSLAWPKVF
jgi:2-deoxy-D-gluconate 3-dehydrogenase